jgi:phosphoenolpyruvate synthase/pyruvate phosphate dikinase
MMPMSPADALILPLSGIDAELVDLVGGKAANLGSLTAAGFPVPHGFCLTTAAYRRVVDAAGLDAALTHLDGVDPGATAAIEAAAARVRSILGSADVPVDIRHAIELAYNEIGGHAAVAVRSSATAEDLPTASFAGQQDSFLGIVGVERVLEAVRQCWVSLWSDRAVTYRRTQGLGHHRVAIAVIVQIMIDSAVAGVLFTANAVTGRRRETVIDASPGAG